MSSATKVGVVEARAVPLRRGRSRRFWIISALVVLGVAGAAVLVVAFLWLQSYAPLEQGSSWGGVSGAEGVTVEPLAASGGVPVVFPRYRPRGRFQFRMSIANTGRLDVTVLGVPKASADDFPIFVPTKVRVSPLNEFGTRLRQLDEDHPVRIGPGEERMVTITYRIAARCVGGQPPRFWTEPAPSAESGSGTVAFRFRYARWLERSQTVRMPFAVALVCVRGIRPLSSR